jgi:peptidoglycan/LPS O-acetylase OafA/YrhL
MHIGVSLFFSLSGFLLTQKYGLSSKFSYQKYYENRFFKIFPLYWFVLLVVILGQKTTEINAILINVLLLQGLWDNAQIWFIQPTWSLTVELIFYLLLPIFVRILAYNKLFFVIICFFVAAFLAYEEAYFLLFNTILGRSLDFLVGMLIAMQKEQLDKKIAALKIKPNTLLLISSVLLIGLLTYYVSAQKGAEIGIYAAFPAFIYTCVQPFVIFLLLYALIRKNEITPNIFMGKTLLQVGRYTYAFFLIHQGFIQTFLWQIFPNRLINFILLCAISVFLFTFVENKIVKWHSASKP